jgi:hypothetical protein
MKRRVVLWRPTRPTTSVLLQTENNYNIIPKKNVQIDVLYRTHKVLEIRRPSLISSNIMKMEGTHKNISCEIKINNNSYSFERRINSLKEYDISTETTVHLIISRFSVFDATLANQGNVGSFRKYGFFVPLYNYLCWVRKWICGKRRINF